MTQNPCGDPNCTTCEQPNLAETKKETATKDESKKCVCLMQDLLIRGCVCGGN